MKIGNRQIGDGHPAYLIAEMSANHAGSLEQAKEIIYQAKEAGADCIKIQTYTADTLTINCDNEYFQLKEPLWKGQNLYHLYEKGYMPWEWQQELKETASFPQHRFSLRRIPSAHCQRKSLQRIHSNSPMTE